MCQLQWPEEVGLNYYYIIRQKTATKTPATKLNCIKANNFKLEMNATCQHTGRFEAEQVEIPEQVIMHCQELQVELRQGQSA